MIGSSKLYYSVVSTQVIKTLELTDDHELSPNQIVKYCDEALQVAEANEELHRATRIFNTNTNAVKRTLKIYLSKCKKMVFELPSEISLDFTDETDGAAN